MIKMLPRRWPHRGGLAALGVGLLLAAPAQARVFIGFGFPLFGPPVYAPPPVYYPPPPPVYYSPPVVYAPPPAYSPVPAPSGQSCYAGGYYCPMDRPVAPGSGCYCTVNGSRVWGRAS